MSLMATLAGSVPNLTFGNFILCTISIYVVILVKHLCEFRGMPPGPRLKYLPFVGNLFDILYEDSSLKGLKQKYGEVFSFQVGSWKVVQAGTPEAIKEILISKSADYAGRPPFYSFLVETLGGKDIAFGNYGSAWKLHRKLFSTCLRQYVSNVPLLESCVGEQAKKLLKFLEYQKEQPFDPSDILMTSIADVICGITFGKYFGSWHKDFKTFLKLTNKSFGDTELNNQLFLLDLFYFTRYFPFSAYKENQADFDTVLGIIRRVLEEGKAHYDTKQVDNLMMGLLKARSEAEHENEEEKKALLSDDYLIGSLYDMMAAGYETTAATLKWSIVYLVNYPDVQTTIQAELTKVVGPNRMPSINDRPHLPYTQAVIMETLRLGNVADQSIPHYTLCDTTLTGYRIPKDTVVNVDLEALHRHPVCWDNPTLFEPRRHLDANGELVTSQGNWLPFSAGRRVCSGEALAKAELFLFLSWMLQKFHFVPEEGEGQTPPIIKAVKGFTQNPAPYKIKAVPRNVNKSSVHYK
ncbi:predicted protein [Nematostella vectensis]|uniref:Steroid 21-hydroxylase n=1 Tax=Nematostella vectensis TaxID=45351 RepID=A7S865_NEMVE|nr:predicted protein [Nematostella vectensis]|eukprot:XP_001632199.1 predicted protein [Nematostella vectensis]